MCSVGSEVGLFEAFFNLIFDVLQGACRDSECPERWCSCMQHKCFSLHSPFLWCFIER